MSAKPKDAIQYTLRRIRKDEAFANLMIATETFARLCEALAELTGDDEDSIRDYYEGVTDIIVKLGPSVIPLDVLESFCIRFGPRKASLGKPFKQNGFVYVASGSVLLEIQRYKNALENEDAPRVGNVISDFSGPCNEPLPSLPEPIIGHCADCDLLDGKIDVMKENDPDCERCGGSGKSAERQRVKIGNREFDSELLRKLISLPNVRINSAGDIGDAMSFTFDEGRGLIMPLKPEPAK